MLFKIKNTPLAFDLCSHVMRKKADLINATFIQPWILPVNQENYMHGSRFFLSSLSSCRLHAFLKKRFNM